MMKKTKLKHGFYRAFSGLILIAFLLGWPVETYSFFYQQTVQVRKIKKTKKRVVRKTVNKNKLTTMRKGVWGGTGIELVIGENEIRIEFDCAEGLIKEKFAAGADGNFIFKGFYKYQMRVIRPGFVPKPLPADFQGKVSGSTMRVKVMLSESGEIVGEYVLTRGQSGKISKCR